MGKKNSGSFVAKEHDKEAARYLNALEVEGMDEQSGVGGWKKIEENNAYKGILQNLAMEHENYSTLLANLKLRERLKDPPEAVKEIQDRTAKALTRVDTCRDMLLELRAALMKNGHKAEELPVPPKETNGT